MAEEESVSNPFSIFDQLYEAGQKQRKEVDTGVGIDRHQVKKMDKKREEVQAAGGQLAAKPRARSRPKRGHIIRGHHENPGAE